MNIINVHKGFILSIIQSDLSWEEKEMEIFKYCINFPKQLWEDEFVEAFATGKHKKQLLKLYTIICFLRDIPEKQHTKIKSDILENYVIYYKSVLGLPKNCI